MRYLIEITLDSGARLLSKEQTGSWDAELAHLRRLTMVESVAVIDVATGEVLCDQPSLAALARARSVEATPAA